MSNEKLYKNLNLCSVVTFVVIIRWSVSLHPYSGQNKPPMFGDYEAQRHWMEITLNLPLEEWYMNTSSNDLMYWGLDYPPLTAYHSYVNGKIGQFINPDFVKLSYSRGYESYDHKFFMRATVIVADLLIYIVPMILYFNSVYHRNQFTVDVKYGESEEPSKAKLSYSKTLNTNVSYLAQITITLLYPGLILIDHGHFQYNSVSLGLTVLAVVSLLHNRLLSSAFCYCLALNYKQMSLYHSLPFFIYMLSKCLQFKNCNDPRTGIQRLFFLSLTVLTTFGIIWFPFFSGREVVFQVVRRIFPLARGLFEDKVSNFWCAVNVIYKLNQISDKILLAKICTGLVIITSIPSLINLFRHPKLLGFLLSMINVSMNFFLFSYQVHEKSILIVALPVLLFFPFDPFPCFWFLLVTTFSMLPLLLKDQLLIPYISLSILFILFVYANVNIQPNLDKKTNKSSSSWLSTKNLIHLSYALFKLSLLGCVLLTVCSVIVTPPQRYPDLWPLLVSVYSFVHFALFSLYFNFVQSFKLID